MMAGVQCALAILTLILGTISDQWDGVRTVVETEPEFKVFTIQMEHTIFAWWNWVMFGMLLFSAALLIAAPKLRKQSNSVHQLFAVLTGLTLLAISGLFFVAFITNCTWMTHVLDKDYSDNYWGLGPVSVPFQANTPARMLDANLSDVKCEGNDQCTSLGANWMCNEDNKCQRVVGFLGPKPIFADTTEVTTPKPYFSPMEPSSVGTTIMVGLLVTLWFFILQLHFAMCLNSWRRKGRIAN
jgi:hypothetical protein